MLPIVWLIVAVLAAILLTMWVTFTLTRLDRLHARVDAAQAALDAQLVRRAAAVQRAAGSSRLPEPVRISARAVAQRAIDAPTDGAARQTVENAVGRTVADLVDLHAPLDADAVVELREAAARVLISRRFYNDAVRDTRALRVRRMPRLLHLAGHRELPDFFDIDDTLPRAAVRDPVDATLEIARPAVPAPASSTAPESPEEDHR